jgi:hypothetical protein
VTEQQEALIQLLSLKRRHVLPTFESLNTRYQKLKWKITCLGFPKIARLIPCTGARYWEMQIGPLVIQRHRMTGKWSLWRDYLRRIPPEIEKSRGYRVTQPTTNRSQSERDAIVKRLADEYVARRLLRKLGDIKG